MTEDRKSDIIISETMNRAHKIRLYPTKEQEQILRQYVGGARFAYNWCLDRWQKWVEEKKQGLRTDAPNWIKLSRIWTVERPGWAKEIPRISVAYAFKGVNTAFTLHFKNGLGWPKFKKKGRCRDSFRLSNDVCSIRKDGKHFHLPGIKNIRIAENLRFHGKVISYTISRSAGKWFVSVMMDVPDTRTAEKSTCGVDVGLKIPAVCSDGSKVTLPWKKLSRLEKKVRRQEHYWSRKQTNSRRKLRARLKVQQTYEKIGNIKRDIIHKFTSAVCKNHETVVIEDINLKGIHHLPKNIRKRTQRSCISEVLNQLAYKAINLVVADKWYPSSQICSNCGGRCKHDLKDRTYRCPTCGFEIGRDLNAAINLSKYPGSRG